MVLTGTAKNVSAAFAVNDHCRLERQLNRHRSINDRIRGVGPENSVVIVVISRDEGGGGGSLALTSAPTKGGPVCQIQVKSGQLVIHAQLLQRQWLQVV